MPDVLQPVDALDLPKCIDLLLGDHSPVADHHESPNSELLAHLVDLRQQGFRIARVALEDRHCYRDPLIVGQQSVVDLELSLLPVPVVPETSKRTRQSFEVA